MAFESERVMFEIYREKTYTSQYRVVYYTELDEHNKHWEINRALSGETFYDGFLKELRKEEGKRVIEQFVERLNRGESVERAELEEALSDFVAQ